MNTQGEEVHFETEKARAAASPNIVRWILAISLLAAIVLLSAIWIFGASTTNPPTESVEATKTALAQTDQEDTGNLGNLDNAATPNKDHLQNGLEVINNDDQKAQ